MLIDLHIHTHYSDGSLSPQQVVEVAKSKELRYIAITDHNDLTAYDEAKPFCDEAGIKLIRGVELDCLYQDRTVHILAYHFNVTEEFEAFVHHSRQELDDVSERLVVKMAADYPQMSVEDYRQFEYDTTQGGWKGIHYLHHLGLTDKLIDGIKFYTKYGCSHATCDFPTVEKACQMIHAAGGVAILAHPGKIYNSASSETLLENLENLRQMGIDGVECYYPIHTPSLTDTCVAFCEAHELLTTVGGDCHGEFLKKDPTYDMGCVKKTVDEINFSIK